MVARAESNGAMDDAKIAHDLTVVEEGARSHHAFTRK